MIPPHNATSRIHIVSESTFRSIFERNSTVSYLVSPNTSPPFLSELSGTLSCLPITALTLKWEGYTHY